MPNVYLEMLFSNISVPSVLIFIGCCIYFNTKDWPPNYLHNFVFWCENLNCFYIWPKAIHTRRALRSQDKKKRQNKKRFLKPPLYKVTKIKKPKKQPRDLTKSLQIKNLKFQPCWKCETPQSLWELLEKKTNTPLKKPLRQSSKPLEENLKITIQKTLEITCLQQP